MAVTGYQPKKYSYQQIENSAPAGQQVSTDPQQMRGVSDQTRAKQAAYQNGYQPSDTVTEAQNRLNQVIGAKPAGYNSKYGEALDSILQEIQNPEKFNYSFANDEMFKYYADLYNQQGRQASADAMGQAAGLTGGYGNSYAQGAGNQAYQQYLLSLYDRGMDFRNAARQDFEADRADRYNRMAALQNADQTGYDRYRDEVADWETERGYYTDRADTEYGRDYEAFLQDRNYWDTQAQRENADFWQAMDFNEQMRQNDAARQTQIDMANAENKYRYDALEEEQNQFGANYEEGIRQFNEQMAENIRQFDASLAEQIRQFDATNKLDWSKLEENQRQFDASLSEEQRQYNKNLAWEYIQAILAQNQVPSNELLVAAGLSLEDAQRMIMQAVADWGGEEGGSGGGGGGGGGSSDKNTGSGKNNQLDGMSYMQMSLDKNADKVAKAVTGYSTMSEALKAINTPSLPTSVNELIEDYSKKKPSLLNKVGL